MIDSLSLSPQTAYTDDDIVASVTASDADGETISLVYEWSVDGIVQTSTSDTLASSNFSKGQNVSLSVTPLDTQGSGVSSSDSVVIQNSPPETPSISVDPVAAFDTDDIVCSIDHHRQMWMGMRSRIHMHGWSMETAQHIRPMYCLHRTPIKRGLDMPITPHDGSEDGAFASLQPIPSTGILRRWCLGSS